MVIVKNKIKNKVLSIATCSNAHLNRSKRCRTLESPEGLASLCLGEFSCWFSRGTSSSLEPGLRRWWRRQEEERETPFPFVGQGFMLILNHTKILIVLTPFTIYEFSGYHWLGIEKRRSEDSIQQFLSSSIAAINPHTTWGWMRRRAHMPKTR